MVSMIGLTHISKTRRGYVRLSMMRLAHTSSGTTRVGGGVVDAVVNKLRASLATEVKLSSIRIIADTSFATSVPVIPIQQPR